MAASAFWWAVAHEETVLPGKPVPVRIGALECVLFRDAGGIIRAVEDRCAHRRAPLSLGVVTDTGMIQCPYHGWRYEGATGKCMAIPNLADGEKVPGNYGVRAYATHVTDGLVFLWTGDAETAILPDFPLFSHAGRAVRQERTLPCPHDMVAALLLDRPGTLLSIKGVRILDDFRWGDPQIIGQSVVGEFGALWARDRFARTPSTPPLTLRLSVDAGTATTRAALSDEDGTLLASALIAPVPQGDWLTRLCYIASASGQAAIDVHARLDPDAIAHVRRAALPDWQRLSAA